jgi:hypothetical protein
MQECGDVANWSQWIATNTEEEYTLEEDFGLAKIAEHFGKKDAVDLYWAGAAKEEGGDVDGAISLYKRAFRQWPALDSISDGGLPRGVREQALTAGPACPCRLLSVIDVAAARASSVLCSRALFTAADLADIEAVRKGIADSEDILDNNPQNATHKHKMATFLNNPPVHSVRNQAPHIIGKMLRFGLQAWEQASWGGSAEQPGPLHSVAGMPSLSIRVVEHWTYGVGGGLVDPEHYDVDSILTIVGLLSEASDYEGGAFRTYESDGSHLTHTMDQGDVICFLSHKYHNITPLTKGVRKSLVMELWQGGVGHSGR